MKTLKITLLSLLITNLANSYPVFAPEGHNLKTHWAVVESKDGKMQEMAEIGARTVAPYTAKELGSYSLYGAVAKENPNILRLLEIYEDEAAYQVHRASEGFKNYLKEREPILEKLTILPVSPIVLEQKKEGEAKVITLTLLEIKKDKLAEFNAVIKEEMTRAVKEDEGVLGLFATAELDDKNNRIHTMEVFGSEEARQNYLNSQPYQNYRQKVESMIENRKTFENYPVNFKLSTKGLHLEK